MEWFVGGEGGLGRFGKVSVVLPNLNPKPPCFLLFVMERLEP